MKTKTKNSIPPKLKSILKKGETSKVEFKESVSSSLGKEMVAFANSSGGKIYIGITDKGTVRGINITNKLKSKIYDIARNCGEVPISIKELENVLLITVKEGEDKPYSCPTGFYIRSGTNSQKINKGEMRDLLIDEGMIRFDNIPCKKFDYKKDFDKEKLFSFLDKSNLTYKKTSIIQSLINLGVAEKMGRKVVFNNAGALFFSKDLKKIHFHAEIACVLFKGLEKGRIIDSGRFNEDLRTNIDEAVKFLEKNLRLEYRIVPGKLQREEILEIPIDALREAVINAVTHRDYFHTGVNVTIEIYDDRVEIYNFGGLPKGLNKKDFGEKSILRNKLIASLMQRLGYIERFGTGVRNMRKLVAKAGLPPIRFKFDEFFTIIFPRKLLYPIPENRGGNDTNGTKSGTKSGTNGTKSDFKRLGFNDKNTHKLLRILSLIELNIFSIESFVKEQRVARRTLLRDLRFLKEKGLISVEGSTRAAKYHVTEKYKKLKKKVSGMDL